MSKKHYYTMSEYLVLKFALRHEHFYGLEVCKATSLSAGAIYPLLSRLGLKHLIEVNTCTVLDRCASDRPERIYYSITELGKTKIMEYEKLLDTVR